MSKILLKGLRITNSLFKCRYCDGIIKDGDLYTSRRNKVYYCITCAEVLNMVTPDEIKDSIEQYRDVDVSKVKPTTHNCGEGDEEIVFTLTPVDEKEKKITKKSRAEIRAEIGILDRRRDKRYRRR